jgi:hypothetical protein
MYWARIYTHVCMLQICLCAQLCNQSLNQNQLRIKVEKLQDLVYKLGEGLYGCCSQHKNVAGVFFYLFTGNKLQSP